MIEIGRHWRISWLLLASVVLTACSILPGPGSMDVYRLPPSNIAAAEEAAVDWGLRVARPSSDDLLGGTRIAVLPDGNRFSVYEGARWNLPAPDLWRDHLLDAFHNDGRVRRLSSDGEMLGADYELGGILRAFQVEYRDGEPEVVVQLDARLVDVRTRQILTSRRFNVTEPAQGEEVPQVVEAFGRASDRLAARIIDWTVQESRRAR